MDIPRIGSGAVYRPPQLWAGRTAESAPDEALRPGSAEPKPAPPPTKTESKPEPKPAGSGRAPGEPLSDEEQKQVAKLKAIDTKVRQHEAAHQAAGGGLAGGASFSYQEGPDGRRYAVGGEVPIKMARSASPEETIRLTDQVRRAALAPADPSGQDLAVASAALSAQAQARKELSAAKKAESSGEGEAAPTPGAPKTAGGPADGEGAAGAAPTAPAASGASEPAASAQAARGAAAYGAAARINAAPSYATALYA